MADRRNADNQRQWMAEKQKGWYEEKAGAPEDWWREKEDGLQDMLDEKAGVPRRGYLNVWLIAVLVFGLVAGVVLVMIVGFTSRPVAQVPPTATPDLTVLAQSTAGALDLQVGQLSSDAAKLLAQCSNNSAKVCTSYPAGLDKLTAAYNLKPYDPAITSQLRNGYLNYANQLFASADTASNFNQGLVEIRKAKKLFPNDKEIDVLEVKADIYQQGWSKLELGRYDEAAGRFSQLWKNAEKPEYQDRKFFDIGRKYYDSLVKLADSLKKSGNTGDAIFYLNEALAINLGPTENKAVQDKLKELQG